MNLQVVIKTFKYLGEFIKDDDTRKGKWSWWRFGTECWVITWILLGFPKRIQVMKWSASAFLITQGMQPSELVAAEFNRLSGDGTVTPPHSPCFSIMQMTLTDKWWLHISWICQSKVTDSFLASLMSKIGCLMLHNLGLLRPPSH